MFPFRVVSLKYLMRHSFSFIITLFINEYVAFLILPVAYANAEGSWLAARGVLNVFCIVGAITLFTTLLTVRECLLLLISEILI